MTTLDTAAHYAAFGITITSEIRLDELHVIEPTDAADVRIYKSAIAHDRVRDDSPAFMDFSDPDAIIMFWPTVACFKIIGDHTVVVDPNPDAEERFLAFPILGPVLAWLLHRKGFFLLHASAIDIDGRTAVFMGDKLAGKSTTAAAFVRAGYPLITDDLVAVSFDEPGKPKIFPAFAQIKLAADAAAAIAIEGAVAQPLIHADFPKRQHRLPTMAAAPVSADWFFVLERGAPQPGMAMMDLPVAIQALNRFSYMSRYPGVKWTGAEDAAHFRSCTRLASLATVSKLLVPAGLERLPETVQFVAALLHGESV